jgi:hypothetical protein
MGFERCKSNLKRQVNGVYSEVQLFYLTDEFTEGLSTIRFGGLHKCSTNLQHDS